ncbi:MAG: hypothetical protein WAM70_16740, partial [Pyrinomonadaceae bacterium]
QQLTRFYVKEQAVNQLRPRRFGAHVDLCLDSDTCFIDATLRLGVNKFGCQAETHAKTRRPQSNAKS